MKKILSILLALACLLTVFGVGASAKGEKRWEIVCILGDVAGYTADDLVKDNDGLWYECSHPDIPLEEIISIRDVDGEAMMGVRLPRDGCYLHSHHGMYPDSQDLIRYNADSDYIRIRIKNGKDPLILAMCLVNQVDSREGRIYFNDMQTMDLNDEYINSSSIHQIEIESGFDGWLYLSLDRELIECYGNKDFGDPATWSDLYWMFWFLPANEERAFVDNTIYFGNIELVNDREKIQPVFIDPSLRGVRMGTAIVDGELDELYKSSAVTDVSAIVAAYNGLDPADPIISAKSYVLRDEERLYVCTVVENTEQVPKGDLYEDISTAIWYYLRVGEADYNTLAFSDGWERGFSSETEIEYKIAKTEGGWIIELAIPYDVSAVVDWVDEESGAQSAEAQKSGTQYPANAQAEDAASSGLTDAPTDAPATATPAPAEQGGNLTWLYIVIGVVIAAAIVVAILLGKKKK